MSSLFGKTPQPEPAVRMPVPDDTESLAAQQRQRQQVAARSGRASTMLSRRPTSSNGGDAGTSSYGNSLLGQAG